MQVSRRVSSCVLLLLIGAAGLAPCGADIAKSAEIIIITDQTSTVSGTATDDRIVVGTGVDVDTGNSDAINAGGGDDRVTNNGSITTTGGNDEGIIGNSGDDTIVNNGSITTQGNNSEAIVGANGNDAITNSGVITTNGNGAEAINGGSGDDRLTNTGRIETSGTNADGITGGNDNDLLSNRGAITTQGNNSEGLNAGNGNDTASNAGVITTNGNGAEAINGGNGDDRLTNTGRIGTTGTNSDGMIGGGGDDLLSNRGVLTTQGNNSEGLNAGNGNDTASNAGVITTNGNGAEAINTGGGNNTVSNSGRLTTNGGNNSDGIVAGGGNDTITNSGIIATWGTNSEGVNTGGGDDTVKNSGRIMTAHANAETVLTGNGNDSVINSGVIRNTAPGGEAIELGGGSDTLSLFSGSFIQGSINPGGGSDTLLVGKGLNVDLEFVSLPETITVAPGIPSVVIGNRVITLDKTLYGHDDYVVARLSDLIHGSIRQAVLGTNCYLPAADTVIYADCSMDRADTQSRVWVQGVAGQSVLQDRATTIDGELYIGGFVMGGDRSLAAGDRIGWIFGAAGGSQRTDPKTHEIDLQTAYAGGYWARQNDGFSILMELYGGAAGFSSVRHINANLAPGGLERARASYDGYFIAPNVTLESSIIDSLHGSIEAGYAGLMLDSYDEHGSSANLSVAARTIHTGYARIQLIARQLWSGEPDRQNHAEARAGFASSWSGGDHDQVEAALGAIPLDFATDSAGATQYGFVGFAATLMVQENLQFFADGELAVSASGDIGMTARFGSRLRF